MCGDSRGDPSDEDALEDKLGSSCPPAGLTNVVELCDAHPLEIRTSGRHRPPRGSGLHAADLEFGLRGARAYERN